MAVRDKSQGVGFVYTNIYELYKKARLAAEQDASASKEASTHKVFRPEEMGSDVKVTTFQPRALKVAESSLRSVPAPSARPSKAFDDLRGNINRLQDLHSKLRFMLHELEGLVEDRKRDSSDEE